MILQDEHGIVYPRVIPVPEGLDWLGKRWEVRETLYQTGKGEGLPYTRYFTKEGIVPSHSGVLSASAAIRLDAMDQGYDDAAAYEAYKQASAERHAREAAERAQEREAAGIVKGEQRESAIRAFHEKYGKLSGAVVQALPGWCVRWDYLPSCNQTHVTYTDSSGKDWKLLKDIEAALGTRVLKGEDLSELIETGHLGADAELFAEGAKRAKASQEFSSLSRASGLPSSSAQSVKEGRDRIPSSFASPDSADLGDLSVEDIQAVFRGLKLEQYLDAVQELSIDGVTLQQMCRTDSLSDMGITNRIHQHKICGHLHQNGLQKLRQLCRTNPGLEGKSTSGPPSKRARALRGSGSQAPVSGSAAESAAARQLCRVRGKAKPKIASEPSAQESFVARSGAAAYSGTRRAAARAVEDLVGGETALFADTGKAIAIPAAAPASYTVVLETGIPVQEGVHLETPHLGKLPRGAVVDVQEAVAFQDRIRGRIEHLLSGWISLSCISTGLVCAERVVSDERRLADANAPQPELPAFLSAEAARDFCSAGHVLEQHVVGQTGWKCNFCQVDQPVGAVMWGCRTCDFDKCASCRVSLGPSEDSCAGAGTRGHREVQVVELDDD